MASSSPQTLAPRQTPISMHVQPLASKPIAISAYPKQSSSSRPALKISNTTQTITPRATSYASALSPTSSIASSSSSSSIKPAPLSASPTKDVKPISALIPVDKKKQGGSSIQPTKKWVLPARAKPGRKPSETEPPTKRKAQNRASQRAFRERKQMYLADLEAKVAAYEKAEIDRSVEIQKAAKRLKEENEALRKENTTLKKRCLQFERMLSSIWSGVKPVAPLPSSSRTRPGCKAPAHEVRAPRKSVLTPAGSKSSSSVPKGEVRFAVNVDSPQRSRAPSFSQDEPMSPSKSTMPISLKPTSAQSAPLWAFKTSAAASDSSAPPASQRRASHASPSNANLSPPLMDDQPMVIEGGCGFCTEASPCVCADDFLNLDSDEKESPKPLKVCGSSSKASAAASSAASVPLPKLSRLGEKEAPAQAPSMRIDAITNSAGNMSLRRKKLWYTVPTPDPTHAVCPTPSHADLTFKILTGSKPKKLWATVPAPTHDSKQSTFSSSIAGPKRDSPEPVCTGDPANCGACSTDPGLAAFCEAVTHSVAGTTATFTSWDTGNAVPLPSRREYSVGSSDKAAPSRTALPRYSTTGHMAGSSSSRFLAPPSTLSGISSLWKETIPSAWKQIRSHPRFNHWQGGLDLLAEVVSKRSGSVYSPLLGERERALSVEIEPTKRTTTESHDRAMPKLVHSASETAMLKREAEEEDMSWSKRRRIFVEREAVEEALALLDRGTAQFPVLTSTLPLRQASDSSSYPARYGHTERHERRHDHAEVDLPCPCPWWKPGQTK